MKKKFKSLNTAFCILFLISLIGPTKAQFSINLEAGANYSNLQLVKGNKVPDASPAYGYFLSISPHYNLNDFLSFKLDIQSSFEPYNYNGFFIRRNHFQFVRLEPNIEIWPINFVSINAGYSVGYKISEEEKLNEVPVPSPMSDFIAPKYDHGFTAGFNIYFGAFYFTGKYYHGSDYFDALFITDSTGTLFVGERIKNRLFRFGLGYKISLDKVLN